MIISAIYILHQISHSNSLFYKILGRDLKPYNNRNLVCLFPVSRSVSFLHPIAIYNIGMKMELLHLHIIEFKIRKNVDPNNLPLYDSSLLATTWESTTIKINIWSRLLLLLFHALFAKTYDNLWATTTTIARSTCQHVCIYNWNG